MYNRFVFNISAVLIYQSQANAGSQIKKNNKQTKKTTFKKNSVNNDDSGMMIER